MEMIKNFSFVNEYGPFYYSSDNDKKPHIEILEYSKGDNFQFNSPYLQIFFILKGSCKLSYEKHIDLKIKENQFIMLPPRSSSDIKIGDSATTIVVFYIHIHLNFCENFPVEYLSEIESQERKKKRVERKQKNILQTNKVIRNYLDDLCFCIENGHTNPQFLQTKQREMFYYLSNFYSKSELIGFFNTVVSKDIAFARLVVRNYTLDCTMESLAESLHYSLSGFTKRFQKIFGITPHQWIHQKKIKKIYYAIICTRKTFAELAFELGFSSPSHFSNFCKQEYGNTPGQLRKQKLVDIFPKE
jgi:AraC-like DNA-binding protein